MCGIAGLFDPRETAPVPDAAALQRMSNAIVHRGPDDAGTLLEPHVALAHRRLSIIDIATGHQPLFNEDASVAVVYNGEIYNYPELTRELEAAGHRFRTRSDTEVIVHAWEQWGERCVERFRGMFAFALWDRRRRTLFLARDRLGVKPLYYGFLQDGTFAFGSELKCLKVLPNFSRRIDDCAVEEYFALGYVPDPRTIYADALKLAPGHTLTYVAGGRGPVLRQYWDAVFEPRLRPSLGDAVVELRQRLEEAVRIRLVSEVPLGAFLSGGVDSGTVVALMAGLLDTPARTCSIGFSDPAFDESRYAQAVADRYGTDHRLEIIQGHDFDLARQVADLYDEPFADSSAVPTWQVSRLARRQVTVALSGDGGDETFGGYRRYKLHLMEERLRSMLPLGLRRAVFGPLGEAFPKLDRLPRPFRAKTSLQAIGRSAVQAYFHSVSLLRDDDRTRLYSAAFRRRVGGYNAITLFEGHAARLATDDALSLIQYLDYKTYLPGDINTKVDRASMAHSLEVREPLMDHELVDWVSKLPSDLKIRGNESKWLLKEAAKPLLPEELLKRRKMGFAVPLSAWFRSTAGADAAQRAAAGPAADGGFIDPARLREMLRQHTTGERDWNAGLWSVFCFDQFLRAEVGTTGRSAAETADTVNA